MKWIHANNKFTKRLFWLMLVSGLTRTLLAWWHELGNDEVYYFTYAAFPDLSHFDHPPMVGWMMQLFSLNLFFDSELFLRLSSVVLMTANTWLIFRTGKELRDERTGWYAALLYNSSVYAFVITGFMILPDTPQNFFWMLSLMLMIMATKAEVEPKKLNFLLAAIGLTIGLGMLSKYTSVFLWFGFGLYILLFRRHWLKKPALYLSVLLSALCLLPVLLWNLENHFVSFTFQGERVNIFDSPLRLSLFFTELGGQVVYNNPVNYILVWLGVYWFLRKKNFIAFDQGSLLLLIALPLVFIFLFFALFRSTLPHWTGPAYNTMLLIAAAWLATRHRAPVPRSIRIAFYVLLVFIVAGSLQIKFGLIPMKDNQPYHKLGNNDVTLDMYGWRELLPAFTALREKHIAEGKMKQTDALLGENWFPLANMDYYLARPLGMKAMGIGEPSRLHKYLWINDIRGGFALGDDFWYITNSRDYKHPSEVYSGMFESIVPTDTIQIMRNGVVAKRYFVFMLNDLRVLPENHLASGQ